jgi:phage minor structural protein
VAFSYGGDTLLEILDQSLQPLAVLEKANNKELERKANNIWFFSFSLPIDDPKNEHCQHFNYVEVVSKTGRKYGKYRILPTETKKQDHSIRYSCEHVIGTLWDDVLDTEDTNGYVQFTNIDVRNVIETLLSFQTTQHWVLGQCDFDSYIESYGFENENNLFNPVFSIPEPLGVPYEFTYNTDVYPFQLNLVTASNEVKSEYRWGKDILEFNKMVDPTDIVNYLIPKGYGEGINALTIKDVNGGLKYLKDDASIAKWGRKSDIRIDRRFKIPASLKRWGENLLSELKDPIFSLDVKAADLSILPGHEHEKRLLNSVANVIVGDDVYQVRIIKETIKDLDREHLVDYELGNEIGNIAKTNADQRKRQEVQERYSNGNTNLFVLPYVDNCDPTHPAIIRYKIPNDLVNYNKLTLTYEVQPFRAYSKAVKGGGAVSKTTAGGGASTQTSSSGGASTQTSSSGGAATVSSSNVDFNGVTLRTGVPIGGELAPYEMHEHYVTLVDNQLQHTHTVNTPAHTHSVNTPAHTHTVNTPSHSHDFELQDHEHELEFGIYEMGVTATSVKIEVDGNILPETSTSGDEIDLVPYLDLDENGRIRRGSYIEIKITPNNLARINASVENRIFISSHVGEVY